MRYQYGQSRRRLSPLLFLSALALVVGVLGGCGSSDSGQDVQPEPEAAAGTSQCPKKDAGAEAVPRVDWRGCDLYAADLRGANLRDANLSGSDLTDANLRYADLNGADLTGASLTGARCNDRTSWPDGTTGHGSTCPG